MQNLKTLLLLVTFVIFVNYINYWLPNRNQKNKQIHLLEHKIAKENRLNKKQLDMKELGLPYSKLFFDDKRYNYSQAMGKFQEIITLSARNTCKVSHIQWAQAPISKMGYDKLKMNLTLKCKPKALFIFVNNLRKNSKLITTTNFKVLPNKRDDLLAISMQVVAYRMHNEK